MFKSYLGIKYWISAAVVVLMMTQFSWKRASGDFNSQIISGDGVGYYQYLVNYFYNGTISNQEQDSDFMIPYNGTFVNKGFSGSALCMLPFYKLSELHTAVIGESFDPYSPRSTKWINLGALVYLFFGCWFIYSWLNLLQLNEQAIFWSILGIVLGSNLFLYSVLSPSMTHVYSFFAISGFIYFISSFNSLSECWSLYVAALFYGLIVIIRPTNGIVILLLPFLFDGVAHLFKVLKKLNLKNYVVSLLLFGAMLFVQFYLWYLQTGDWVVWSYQQEGFNWSNPQVFEVLFGFRKGWFVYTPIAMLAMFGLAVSFKNDKLKFGNILILVILVVYIVSAWWNWFYGSSFSQRAMVDFYPIIVLLLATLLHYFNKNRFVTILLKVIIVCLIGLNLFQSFQYKENLISSWDMTFKKYVATFGVYEPNQIRIGGSREILPFKAQKYLLVDSVLANTQAIQSKVQEKNNYFNYSGKEYGIALKTPLENCSDSSRGFFVEMNYSRLELELNSSGNAKVIVELKNNQGEEKHYSWFLINEVPSTTTNIWVNYNSQVMLPECDSNGNDLLVYIRNEDKANFLISNFRVKVSAIY